MNENNENNNVNLEVSNDVTTSTTPAVETPNINTPSVENINVNNEKKKKKIVLPLKIILIGCILGFIALLVAGGIHLFAIKTNHDRAAAAYNKSQERVKAAQKRLEEIAKELEPLNIEYDKKDAQCEKIRINMSDPDWYEKNNTCSRERGKIYDKIKELENEEANLKTTNYTEYYSLVNPWTYRTAYIIALSIVVLSLLAGFIIYLVKGEKTYN